MKAETLERPLNSFLMHPHVEFVIMEAVLDYPIGNLTSRRKPFGRLTEELKNASYLRYLTRDAIIQSTFSHQALLLDSLTQRMVSV